MTRVFPQVLNRIHMLSPWHWQISNVSPSKAAGSDPILISAAFRLPQAFSPLRYLYLIIIYLGLYTTWTIRNVDVITVKI